MYQNVERPDIRDAARSVELGLARTLDDAIGNLACNTDPSFVPAQRRAASSGPGLGTFIAAPRADAVRARFTRRIAADVTVGMIWSKRRGGCPWCQGSSRLGPVTPSVGPEGVTGPADPLVATPDALASSVVRSTGLLLAAASVGSTTMEVQSPDPACSSGATMESPQMAVARSPWIRNDADAIDLDMLD